MGKKVIETCYCDRCKTEVKEENYVCVCDAIDHYFYDLCKDCHKAYKEYVNEIENLEAEFKAVRNKWNFGPQLFIENKEGDNK